MKINKAVGEIYQIFDEWTDLGAEPQEVIQLKKKVRKKLKKLLRKKKPLPIPHCASCYA